MNSYNPFTGDILGEIEETTPENFEQIVKTSRNKYTDWSKIPLEQRASKLSKLPAIILSAKDAISNTLVNETGMPITEARSSTEKLVQRIEFLIHTSPDYLREEKTILPDNKINKIRYEPIGVVACIMPWNHPFTIPFWSIIPALIAGNTVIYKPSELTPLVGKQLNKAFDELDLPNGVFSTVQGDGSLGKLISTHPDIKMISYA